MRSILKTHHFPTHFEVIYMLYQKRGNSAEQRCWSHFDSWKLAMVGVFLPWKLSMQLMKAWVIVLLTVKIGGYELAWFYPQGTLVNVGDFDGHGQGHYWHSG